MHTTQLSSTWASSCRARPGAVVQQRRSPLQRPRLALAAAVAEAAGHKNRAAFAAEDKWVERSLQATVPDNAVLPKPLASLQSSCLSALSTVRMPTTRNEEYRFTDISPLLQQGLSPASGAASAASVDIGAICADRSLKQPAAATIVVVDGVVDQQQTSINELPTGVYVGSLAGAPQDVVSFALGSQSRSRGGPFATLNGAAARDAVVMHVPANTVLPSPVHVLYLASSSATPAAAGDGHTRAAAPRLLVVLEEGAVAEVIEEFGGLAGPAGEGTPATATDAAATADAEAPSTSGARAPAYFTNAVAEFELDDGAVLKHSYVQLESSGTAHMKATLVNQGRESSYSLVEARVGGSLSRHDVSIEQLGEATQSQMRSFLLCGDRQLHDLHSKLKLDHPNGEANQLHKCIVSSPTGRGVFDGNVRVNRLAQKTDAQQLSRNLLLVPRAMVNVKPNLQIIADDVKCTHGCTVSDLEEEELFYLRARGISTEVARRMLVYSFGREVVQGLGDNLLQARVEAAVRNMLSAFASHL